MDQPISQPPQKRLRKKEHLIEIQSILQASGMQLDLEQVTAVYDAFVESINKALENRDILTIPFLGRFEARHRKPKTYKTADKQTVYELDDRYAPVFVPSRPLRKRTAQQSYVRKKQSTNKPNHPTPRQKPTQDTEQATKDTPHNDFITFVMQQLETWHQDFSMKYQDVIQMQHGNITDDKLQDAYPKVDPAKRQGLLERRTAQMKRDIRTKIQPWFSDKPDATEDEKREIEREIITRFWGTGIAHVLDNVDNPHT